MICGDMFRQLKQHNCLYYLNSGFPLVFLNISNTFSSKIRNPAQKILHFKFIVYTRNYRSIGFDGSDLTPSLYI